MFTKNVRSVVVSFIVVLISNNLIFGQQWNQYSLTPVNLGHNFSSYAGIEQNTTIVLAYRNQWQSLPNHPSSFYINGHSQIANLGAGIGIEFANQKIGNFSLSETRLSVNKLFFTPYGLFSAGIRASYHGAKIDGESIVTPEGSYVGQIDHKDPLLTSTLQSGKGIGLEGNIFFRTSNVQLGLSYSSLWKQKIDFVTFKYILAPTIQLFYQHNVLVAKNVRLQPFMYLMTDLSRHQLQWGSMIKTPSQYFGGLFMRGYNKPTIDAIGLIFGYTINKRYSIIYNYDFGVSKLKQAHENSHEIVLKMNFDTFLGKIEEPRIIYNPRFL